MTGRTLAGLLLGLAVPSGMLSAGCGDSDGGEASSASGGSAASGNASSGGNGAASSGGTGAVMLPVGGSGGGAGSGGQPCGAELDVIIRDFKETHPDFEAYSGSMPFTGIVEDDLGDDNKPVYAHAGSTAQTTGPEEFAEWYNDVEDVNERFDIKITLSDNGSGVLGYQNNAFFPIDGQGFGDEGNPHNFHFTTEIHTQFTYEGGETFTFIGDDDLWLFVNGKLALDLGGLHPEFPGTVDFDAMADELGIEIGETYPMDIFHAERHTTESNFTIETNIECFEPQAPK